MSYGTYDKYVRPNVNPETAVALEAAAAVVATWNFQEPAEVTRVGFQVTVAFDYDTQITEGVLKFYKRPTYGSDTGRIELASLDLTDGLAAGHCYFVDVPASAIGGIPASGFYRDVKAGEQVIAEITTQASGGTEVGDFQPYICFNPRAENVDNQSYLHNVTP